ncbi:MAG: hypothetical protein LW832_06700 [Parachlamydia sp.]|jgi:hypothetical protein|nr:hypothetical protein [Parachlamydia sp.]
MTESIQYYSERLIVEPTEHVVATVLSTLSVITNSVAVEIIVQAGITFPLFCLHHNLFALGFTAGFIFADTMKEIVEKVNVVYNAKRSLLENICLVGISTPLLIITMPTTIVVATLYYSARWGSFLYHDSLRRQQIPVEPTV